LYFGFVNPKPIQMKNSIIKDFYRTIHLDDLTLAYSGNFTDSMTEKIIELSETYLDSNEKLGKLKRRTSFLVAECFQNVVRHSTKELYDQKARLQESFFLRFYDNRCYIASENLVPNSAVAALKSQLDLVNNYNKDELKDLYRNILSEGTFSEKGGAGLGLVEMARKTGNRLSYSFERDRDDHSFFYLMLVLENESDDAPVRDHSEELEVIKKIIKNVQEDNMFLLYKGDFEREILDHIEQILERNLDSQKDSLATKIKLYHAAAITMHKIGTYSHGMNDKSNGMLFFGRNHEGYLINATFPLLEEKKVFLNEILSEIKNSSKEELNTSYREQLKVSSKENIQTPGLGFTQLALIAKSWDYEFDSPEGLLQELVYQVYI
jgi:hypothetical protein